MSNCHLRERIVALLFPRKIYIKTNKPKPNLLNVKVDFWSKIYMTGFEEIIWGFLKTYLTYLENTREIK